jgi:DNA-binding NarL/FixJ family response regulator
MPLRILVVDDYEPIRRYLCSTVEQAECQVIGEASDGLEAVQKAVTLQPDLVLLDVHLPKLNGLEAARQIHQIAPLTKILFISQEFSLHVVEAALRLGAVGYVDKLRVHRDLQRAIDAILKGQYFVSGVVRGGFGQTAIDKPPIRHEVQFCSDDAVLRESFIDFIAETLRSDKACILVAGESHRAGILQGLRAKNLDVSGAVERGTLVSVDVAEILSMVMLKESVDPLRFFDVVSGLVETAGKAATTERGPLVAVCRECPPAMLAEGKLAQAVQLEKLWDLIAYLTVFDVLCGYALRRFEKHQSIFRGICAQHSAVHSR